MQYIFFVFLDGTQRGIGFVIVLWTEGNYRRFPRHWSRRNRVWYIFLWLRHRSLIFCYYSFCYFFFIFLLLLFYYLYELTLSLIWVIKIMFLRPSWFLLIFFTVTKYCAQSYVIFSHYAFSVLSLFRVSRSFLFCV